MTANAKPACAIPGIAIVKMNPADYDRFKGLLDGFQQNVPQSKAPQR